MGAKIPEPIRRKVLREWIQGIPGRQIARDNQIGTGTVIEIIKAIKERDSEAQIDTLRETAVMLRREGLSIDDFAQSIHLKKFLNKIGLNDEQLEDFIRPLEVHCFKRGLTPEKFMDLVQEISSLSDNLGIPVEELPERINGLKRSLDDISFEIRDLIIKKGRAISSYNTTVADLEEYKRNRPLIEALKAKDEELERERERRTSLENELLEKDEELERERERRNSLESELLEKEYEWFIHEDEIKRINEGLEIPIDIPELYKLAKDLFHQPSKYPDIVRTMRELQSTARNRANLTGADLTDTLAASPATSTTITTRPTNTLLFSNSNPNPPPTLQNATTAITLAPTTLQNATTAITLALTTLQNATTAITLAPPPSASNPTPNNITSSGPRRSESNTTPTPSAPSNQQTITQGTDNSACRSNPNPPPTQQNTTTNLVGDYNKTSIITTTMPAEKSL